MVASVFVFSLLAAAHLLWAQDPITNKEPGPPMEDMGPGGKMGMGEDKMMMRQAMMCPICSAAIKGMMNPQIVATSDGSVIVAAGPRLMKYDKDLNLVKEVEIKIDMQAMMEKMKSCPMCQMMKEKGQGKKEMMRDKEEGQAGPRAKIFEPPATK